MNIERTSGQFLPTKANGLSTQLICVIATLLIASPSANALDLNIYGVGHLSVDNVSDGTGTSIYLASNSSRLGFSGEHQLTSGLTVLFQIESGVDLTAQGDNDGNGPGESSGQIFTKGRPSFVGLEGRFGKALWGHMPALDQWANTYNLFADQVGDLGNFWEHSGLPGRADNVIYYESPDINGFKTAITYVPEEGMEDGGLFIVKGNYGWDVSSSGKLNMDATFASVGQGAGLDDQTAIIFTFAYHSGLYSFGGGYQSESDIGGASGSDRESLYFGGSYKVGDKGLIKAQWANSTGEGAESDAVQWAIGYDYDLGDQTTVYAAYASMANDDMTHFHVNGKGKGDRTNVVLGDDPSVISFGIVYKFNQKL